MAALKNAATQFTTEQYFQNRTLIEDALFKALQTRLSEMHVFVPQMFLVMPPSESCITHFDSLP